MDRYVQDVGVWKDDVRHHTHWGLVHKACHDGSTETDALSIQILPLAKRASHHRSCYRTQRDTWQSLRVDLFCLTRSKQAGSDRYLTALSQQLQQQQQQHLMDSWENENDLARQ
jgi:hypothetical protein